MTKKFALAKEEIRERLREQLSFLVKSAAEYDAGDEAEARRLALSLRVLLHHHGQSKAILSQLGMRESISYVDTCGPLDTTNMLTQNPMVMMRLSGAVELSRFIPALDTSPNPHHRVPFAQWWNMPVIRSMQANVEFCRRELVLAVANQDGGAHVDSTLDMKYARLSRLHEFGWTIGQGEKYVGPLRPIELAHIRQIAYEVLATLATKVSYARAS